MRFQVCLCILTAAAAAAPCERAGTLLPAEVGQEKRADYETVTWTKMIPRCLCVGGAVEHPRLASHGPTLFAGLSKHVDLKLVSRLEFGSGAVAMRYEPRR